MKKNIFNILSVLFALLFINGGLDKFLHYMPPPTGLSESALKMMAAFTEIGWLMPLIGVAEILGGILFLLPKFRALGALILFPILFGIVVLGFAAMPDLLILNIVLVCVFGWVIYENRSKYMGLIS